MNTFDESLLGIIEERQSVLFEIERVIFTRRYTLSAKHKDIFSTQSISMIYSIWEGFVQQSFNLYIDELNNVDSDFYEFCDGIVIHHMESTFKQFKQYPIKDNKKIKFFTSLKAFHISSNYSIKRTVNTENNVGFDVLNKLLKCFALEQFPEHWEDYSHPNPNLIDSLELFLRLRNTVAHGGDLALEDRVNQEVYIRFKKLVIDLMYAIRLKMLSGLNNQTFKKL